MEKKYLKKIIYSNNKKIRVHYEKQLLYCC